MQPLIRRRVADPWIEITAGANTMAPKHLHNLVPRRPERLLIYPRNDIVMVGFHSRTRLKHLEAWYHVFVFLKYNEIATIIGYEFVKIFQIDKPHGG